MRLSVRVNNASRKPGVLLFLGAAVVSISCSRPPTAPNATATPSPQNISGPPGLPTPIMNKPYPGTGVVVTVNRNEGWVEINHEEIKDLMPAMQMEFNVKDKSLLNNVKAGDKVNFTIVETEKGEFLTAIKPAAKPSP